MVFLVKQIDAVPTLLVKDGTYRATVSGLKQSANAYGERIGFEFTIHGGQFDGETVMRSTTPQLIKQLKLAKVSHLVMVTLITRHSQDQTHVDLLDGMKSAKRCLITCSPQ
jgi:hypothetical protein